MCKMNNNSYDKAAAKNDAAIQDNDDEFVDSDIDEDEDLEEDLEEENENIGKVIDVAFDARPPCNADFHGIKRLLQQLFVKYINEELSELANFIVEQHFVGCVLKQDCSTDMSDSDDESSSDDDHVYAVSTVINLSENQNLSCIEKINDLLISKCEEHYKAEPTRMANLIRDPSKQVGLLISERFINIPPQVALPSYQSLKSDIESAVRKRRKFNFSHLVLISKSYSTKTDGPKGELFFTNAEEQLFMEMSEFNFTFSVADQRDSMTDGTWNEDGSDFDAHRTIMVFDASALGPMIAKLQTELSPA